MSCVRFLPIACSLTKHSKPIKMSDAEKDVAKNRQVTSEAMWCPVGNIVEVRPYGPSGRESRAGTKHFVPGARVICHPPRWDPGPYPGSRHNRITVTGHHRGSGKLVTMVIRPEWVTDWRAKQVYSPAVLRAMKKAGRCWDRKEDVDAFLENVLRVLSLPLPAGNQSARISAVSFSPRRAAQRLWEKMLGKFR